MSYYADYLRETTGDEIIEDEVGFATYRFLDEKTCYIVHIYTIPEFRKTKRAADKADLIVGIAKKRGCSKLVGSVVPSSQGSTRSLQVLLGYGMNLESCQSDFILFSKEI